MMEIIVTSERIGGDPDGRQLLDHLQESANGFGFGNSIVYYDFPQLSDYDAVLIKTDILILSERKGIFAIRIGTEGDLFNEENISFEEVDDEIDQLSSLLFAKLLKSKMLRNSRTSLKLNLLPIIFLPAQDLESVTAESELASSLESLDQIFLGASICELSDDEFSEARSVIEGAKALSRPKPRSIGDPEHEICAVAMSRIESEISNFDEHQRGTALSIVRGPQRIRGLAGSGKTIVLAMKAAHLHLTHPNAKILITFFTKSLYDTLERLITRFYRHNKEEDPDWSKIQIRHGWGGRNVDGVYSDACRRAGQVPINYGQAQARVGGGNAFDYVCQNLVDSGNVKPYYDFILIDEGQDFPSGFYGLCFELSNGERDQKSLIWAYDELQNILNVKIRSPEELFGIDQDGQPKVSLQRSSKALPITSANDIILSKCYRNQREILVISHAVGFGVYSEIVQMLENDEHWSDVGYEVIDGPLQIGKPARILRPEDNSPMSIDLEGAPELIQTYSADDFESELAWVIDQIQIFLNGGMNPEDVLVISLDDRNAKTYLSEISNLLAEAGIKVNNLIADPYSNPPFFMEGRVSLSTVYRAKGNEAAVVFVVGVDGVKRRMRSGRNRLFTAFTRSKAWLRISGIGKRASIIFNEIELAQEKFPYLEFVMPDPEQVETIQRDLSQKAIQAVNARDKYIAELREIGLGDEEINEQLISEATNEPK